MQKIESKKRLIKKQTSEVKSYLRSYSNLQGQMCTYWSKAKCNKSTCNYQRTSVACIQPLKIKNPNSPSKNKNKEEKINQNDPLKNKEKDNLLNKKNNSSSSIVSIPPSPQPNYQKIPLKVKSITAQQDQLKAKNKMCKYEEILNREFENCNQIQELNKQVNMLMMAQTEMQQQASQILSKQNNSASSQQSDTSKKKPNNKKK